MHLSGLIRGALLVLLASCPLAAQMELLPEFRVDATITGKGAAACAANDAGALLVAWVDNPYYGDQVLVRLLDRDGLPLAPQILAGQAVPGNTSAPAVSSGAGSFAVAWGEVNGWIHARGIGGDGNFATPAILVSNQVNQAQWAPTMTVLGSEYWIQWLGGIDPYGNPGSSARTLSTLDFLPSGAQVTLAALEPFPVGNAATPIAGGVLAAWGTYHNGREVTVQQFDATGAPLGPQQILSDDVGGYSYSPSLAQGTAGRLAAWLTDEWDPKLGRTATRVEVRVLDSLGSPTSSTITLDRDATNVPPTVASDGHQGYFVVWTREEPAIRVIVAQRLDSAGQPLTPPVVAGDDLGFEAIFPNLCEISPGRVLLVWTTRAAYLDEYISGRILVARGPVVEVPALGASARLILIVLLAALSLVHLRRRRFGA